MNSKSRKILLYVLCGLMALTQVAFVGLGKNGTSEESVINETNESIEAGLVASETKYATDNLIESTEPVLGEVPAANILDMVDKMNLKQAVIVENESDEVSTEEYLGEVQTESVSKYQDMIVSYADPYLPVRTEASRDSKTVGKLFPGSYGDIVERGEEWTKIKSGKVEGYIQNIYVCFDQEAEDLAGQLKGTLATALTLEEEAARKKKNNPSDGPIVADSYETCLLAAIIDWEANSECYDGKVAVGVVVLNRVRSASFGNSIQAVLQARGQFGGVTDGGGWSSAFQARINKYVNGASNECSKAASVALAGSYNPLNATYYYFNTRVGSVSMVQQIGSHYFYNY